MRISSTLCLLTSLLCVVVSASAYAQGVQSTPPADLPVRPYVTPKIQRLTLSNGLRMLVAEQHSTPLVTIRLSIPVGAVNDPTDQPGLASAVASQLTAGTDKYSSVQLREAIEDLGGTLSVGAGADFTTLSASVLSENVNAMAELISDTLLHPAFPDSELKIFKGLQMQGLTLQRQNPGFLSQEQLAKALYGKHPYSVVSTTPAAVNALTPEVLTSFYKRNYVPKGAVLIVVGDISASKAQTQFEKALGAWKGAGESAITDFAGPPVRTGREVILVNRPGSVQSNIVFGNLAIKRNDPDYFALSVANIILGGGSASRLFNNVREKQGFAYNVGSAANTRALAGDYTLNAQTRTDVTAAALKEMFKEEERIRTEPVSDAELKSAKSYLSGVFVISLTSQDGVADRLLIAEQNGLPTDYLSTFRDKVAAITAADVQRVAAKYLQPDRSVIVVVGDADKVRDSLGQFGPLTEPK